MSGNLLEAKSKAAGDSCTMENLQLNVCSSEKLLDVNVAAGEPGIGEQMTIPSEFIEDISTINELKEEIQKRTHERDNYAKILAETERQLVSLQTSDNNNPKTAINNEMSLRRELDDVKKILIQAELKLQDRNRLIANQENQINALAKQVSSLKEVVGITKNLLDIRNTEVKHLQENVDSMETKISAERSRHDSMINKMNAAVRLNADLKTEYETQLRLFQDLRGKYQEKVTLLSSENKALEIAATPKVE